MTNCCHTELVEVSLLIADSFFTTKILKGYSEKHKGESANVQMCELADGAPVVLRFYHKDSQRILRETQRRICECANVRISEYAN